MFFNSNDDKSDDKSNEKIADDSIESIPFLLRRNEFFYLVQTNKLLI